MFFRLRPSEESRWIYGSFIYYSNPNLLNLQIESFPPSIRALGDIDAYCCSSLGIPFMFVPAINFESSKPPKITFGTVQTSASGRLVYKSGGINYQIDKEYESFRKLRVQVEDVMDTGKDDHSNESLHPPTFHLEQFTEDSGAIAFKLRFNPFCGGSNIKTAKEMATSWIDGLHYHYFRITNYLLSLILSDAPKSFNKKVCYKSGLTEICNTGYLNAVSTSNAKSKSPTNDFWLYLPPSKPRCLVSFISNLWHEKTLERSHVLENFDQRHPYLAGFYLAKLTDIDSNHLLLKFFDCHALKEFTIQPIEIGNNRFALELLCDLSLPMEANECNTWSEQQYLYPCRQFFIPFDSFSECSDSKKQSDSMQPSYFKYEVVKNNISQAGYNTWSQQVVPKHSASIVGALNPIASQQKDFLNIWKLEGKLKKRRKDSGK